MTSRDQPDVTIIVAGCQEEDNESLWQDKNVVLLPQICRLSRDYIVFSVLRGRPYHAYGMCVSPVARSTGFGAWQSSRAWEGGIKKCPTLRQNRVPCVSPCLKSKAPGPAESWFTRLYYYEQICPDNGRLYYLSWTNLPWNDHEWFVGPEDWLKICKAIAILTVLTFILT